MRMIPVLDLLNGVVVRGVAGRREEYRPVQSRLVDSSDPFAVAAAFREHLGTTELYLADLDGIMRDQPNVDAVRRLAAAGFQLLVDAGLRDVRRGEELIEAGVQRIIAGLESSPGPQHLEKLVERFGPQKVTFSLDLQAGTLLCEPAAWETSEPYELAHRVVDCGVRSLIVLDLAGVGVGEGVSTAGLCSRLRAAFPHEAASKPPFLELVTGGGVRNLSDLQRLRRAGVDAVLVASALHDGSLSREDLATL